MNTRYDVDTLFIIKKDTAKERINLNDLLQQYDLLDEYNDKLIINKGDYYGFSEGKQDYINGVELHTYLHSKISELEDEIRYKRSNLMSTKEMTEKKVLTDALRQMEKDYYTIVDVASNSTKNAIVDLFARNISDKKNRTDLLTPISFLRVSSVKTQNIADFYDDLGKDEALLQDLVEAGIITVQC